MEREEQAKGGRRVTSLSEGRDFRGQRGWDGTPPSSEQEGGSEPSGQSPYLQLGKLRLREASQ